MTYDDEHEAAGTDEHEVGPRQEPDPRVGTLSEQEQRILAFERQWFRRPGAKDAAIRQTFGLSTTGYYQILTALIRRPEALQHDPLLVNRLLRTGRRQRDRRGLPLT